MPDGLRKLREKYNRMDRLDRIIAHLRAIYGQTLLVRYMGGDPVFSKKGFFTFIPF